MNNPRLLKMASYRSKRVEESNLINFIDRLPHIMKEDKMLLRKRAKDGDPTLLELLRKRNLQHFKDDDDFKRLEATVRKYLNDLKSSAREEQITKYKNTLKSYRSSCEKPGNKQNVEGEKKGLVLEANKFERANPKSARSPTSSLQKLHELKNFKSNKPVYQSQRLETLKAKYSMEKDKYRNMHLSIELGPKSKMRSSKLISGSASTRNLTKKQVAFDANINLNLKTETSQTLSKCHTDRQFLQHPKNDAVSIAQFQDLFTPPDLLRECKMILEKAKQVPSDAKGFYPSDPISPKFYSNSGPTEHTQYLCPKQKPPLQQYSSPQTVSFCKEESDSNLLDSNLFKKPTEEKIEKIEKADFETKTAEYVFDCIFTDSHEVTFEAFSEIANKLFSSPLELYRLFQRADVNHSGIVTIYELGKSLQETSGSEENYIKDIFELLDMDRKGYITESDISNFVRQIVDTSYENESVVRQMFMRVLYEADFKNNGKIEYWALYYVKGLECFKEMVVYISQFEFEVQC